MSDEVFVDASEPFVFSDTDPLTFFKATLPNTWLYATQGGRIAMDGDQYRLALIRNRKKQPGSSGGLELVTKGGTLALQVNVAPLIGNAEDEKSWSDAIKRHSPFIPPGVDRINLRPLGLRNSRYTITGLEGLVATPNDYLNVPVGSSASVPITLPLTADGADTLWGILGRPVGFPINILFQSEYDSLWPGAHYRITADTRKVYDFFSVNVKARASYFGLVGAQADVSVVRTQLIGSGAVNIEWLAKPEGFDEAHVAQLQNSILDAFARSALNLMVKDVVADTAAPDPQGFFGGVSVKLKDVHEVENLNLSGEFKEADLRTQTFSFTLSLAQFHNLDRAKYGVDITGDNMLPITLNLGKDGSHVRKYLLQYGYRRPDGSVQSDSAEATGQDGLLLKGVVQWDPHDPEPKNTEIQFGVDWQSLDWEGYSDKIERSNGDSGVLFEFTPGTYVKQVGFLSDLTRAEPGTFSSLEWRTVLPPNPEGTQPKNPKNYSGGMIYEGGGASAAPDKLTIEFPYNNETADAAKFEWEVKMVKPDGTVLQAKDSKALSHVSFVLAVRGLLKPAPPNAPVPQVAAALRFAIRRPDVAPKP